MSALPAPSIQLLGRQRERGEKEIEKKQSEEADGADGLPKKDLHCSTMNSNSDGAGGAEAAEVSSAQGPSRPLGSAKSVDPTKPVQPSSGPVSH